MDFVGFALSANPSYTCAEMTVQTGSRVKAKTLPTGHRAVDSRIRGNDGSFYITLIFNYKNSNNNTPYAVCVRICFSSIKE